jgi:putative ABC transport system permease protein
MSLWKIAWRSIQQRSLASALTAVSMSLGVMLVVAVLVVYSVVNQAFHRGGEGYNLIVGPASGSNLSLVLSSIFYVGQPDATMPYTVFDTLNKSGGPARGESLVEVAIPVCLGDTYKDKPVVGTTPDMFDKLTYYTNYGQQNYEFAEGNNFGDGESEYFHAVAGAAAARQLKLKVGDTFKPTHSAGEGKQHEHGAFTIVGILKPTGTPNDNGLFVHLEGFYRVGGHSGMAAEASESNTEKKTGGGHRVLTVGDQKHDAAPAAVKSARAETDPGPQPKNSGASEAAIGARSGEVRDEDHEHMEIPDSKKRVSAVLVRLYDDKESQTPYLRDKINAYKDADWNVKAAIPSKEIYDLFNNIIGNLKVVLLVFAVMIVLVAGIGIMVSIYNSMNDRRHEIAIMRALGAQRSTVMIVILLESILLSLGGGLLGLGMGHTLLAVAGPWIAEQVNLPLSMLQFYKEELILIPGLIVLASIVGYMPAVAAYRTDVGKSLIANP